MVLQPTDPPKLLISYRRSDSQHITERTADQLTLEFGSDSVFLDTEDIPFGQKFDEHIQTSLNDCRVLLAMIGEGWLNATSDGTSRRLDDVQDTVRRELQWARELKIDVVPILIDGARMPKKSELPESIQFITDINALPMRSGQDFRFCTQRLIVFLQDKYAFPCKNKSSNWLSWISGVGLGAAIFGGLVSVTFVGNSLHGQYSAVNDPSEISYFFIAMELMGPILMGTGMMATAYACHKSCVLKAISRRPDYLGIASAEKTKHPAVQLCLAFSIATFGWNLFAFVPAVFFYFKSIVAIRKAPERYESLNCANIALLVAAIGMLVSTVAQSAIITMFKDSKATAAAINLLDSGDFEAAISTASAVEVRRPSWPQPSYVLGKAKANIGDCEQAIIHLSNAIHIQQFAYDRDRRLMMPPPYLPEIAGTLIELYELRSKCYAQLGNGTKSQQDLDSAKAIDQEFPIRKSNSRRQDQINAEAIRVGRTAFDDSDTELK